MAPLDSTGLGQADNLHNNDSENKASVFATHGEILRSTGITGQAQIIGPNHRRRDRLGSQTPWSTRYDPLSDTTLVTDPAYRYH